MDYPEVEWDIDVDWAPLPKVDWNLVEWPTEIVYHLFHRPVPPILNDLLVGDILSMPGGIKGNWASTCLVLNFSRLRIV